MMLVSTGFQHLRWQVLRVRPTPTLHGFTPVLGRGSGRPGRYFRGAHQRLSLPGTYFICLIGLLGIIRLDLVLVLETFSWRLFEPWYANVKPSCSATDCSVCMQALGAIGLLSDWKLYVSLLCIIIVLLIMPLLATPQHPRGCLLYTSPSPRD